MRMNLETRLRKLEGGAPETFKPCHRVIGDSAQECEAQKRQMIEAGRADELDEFVFFVIVTPGDILTRTA
jgi:hypothetical protein